MSFTGRTITAKSKSSILQFILDGTGMSPSAKAGDSAEDPALQSVRRHNSEGNLNDMMRV